MWLQVLALTCLPVFQEATPVPRLNVVVPRPADVPYLTELVIKPLTNEIVIEPPRRFGERATIVKVVLEASDTGERGGFGDLLLFAGESEKRTVAVGGHRVVVAVSLDEGGRRALVEVEPEQRSRRPNWPKGQRIAVWLPGAGSDEGADGPWPVGEDHR